MSRVVALLTHPAAWSVMLNVSCLGALIIAYSGYRLINGHLADVIVY